MIVKLKGNYTGSKILYFNIVPKQVNVTYVNSTSKGFLMQWKKYNYKITGFQIQYAANRKFKSAKKIWINNNKTSLYNCEIEIIDNTEKTEQQELVEDLVQIITVFSCKLQGKRANKARKLVKEFIEEGGEDDDPTPET